MQHFLNRHGPAPNPIGVPPTIRFMYEPGHFGDHDEAQTLAMLRSTGFGHLVVADGEQFEASPLPFLVEDDLSAARMHVARPNRIWRLAPCPAFLAVTASDAYISPSWYASTAEHGRVVPTWNYEVVYLHGHLVAHDDDAWIADQMRSLTDHHEAGVARPWSVDDPPDGYIEKMRRGTVGLELHVTRIESKRKLGQNRSHDDVSGVISGLRAEGRRQSESVASAMDT